MDRVFKSSFYAIKLTDGMTDDWFPAPTTREATEKTEETGQYLLCFLRFLLFERFAVVKRNAEVIFESSLSQAATQLAKPPPLC